MPSCSRGWFFVTTSWWRIVGRAAPPTSAIVACLSRPDVLVRYRAVPTTDDAARMVPTYTGPGGATAANVLHFVSIGGGFDQAAVDFWLEKWSDFVRQLMNDDWSVDALAQCLDLRDDPPDELVASFPADNGVGTGAPLPAQCSWVLSLGAGGGRRRKGRIYIPGIGELDVADTSTVGGSFITAATDGYAAFAQAVAITTQWVPAVYSRADNAVHAVQTISGDAVIDTQRRRVERLA